MHSFDFGALGLRRAPGRVAKVIIAVTPINVSAFLFACLALTALAPRCFGQTTATLTTVYTFSHSGESSSIVGLAEDAAGNLYGTTDIGGANDDGTVFGVTVAGDLIFRYDFSGADGSEPDAALAPGVDGNFYGSTSYGGNNNDGTIFVITPAGGLTTLYQFDATDGYFPNGLVQAADGNFYGTTTGGGGTDGHGTVFKITPQGVLTTLHIFTVADGSQPSSALVQGSDGNLYGMTPFGGSSNAGTIFRITTAGVFTTLYNFTGGADGGQPLSALVEAGAGIFYGTAKGGTNGAGTVFTITSQGVFNLLYTFSGPDGSTPTTLVLGNDGNFYGTTKFGGASGFGTIFQVTPAGALTTLYSFTSVGTLGIYPEGDLLLSKDGYFYGTTAGRSASGTSTPAISGTIYRAAVSTSGGTVQFAVASSNVDENAGSITLTVQRVGDPSGAILVNYAETDGTALSGTDYTATTGQLMWGDGDQTNRTFTVPIIDRHLDTGSQLSFSATLKPVTGGGNVGAISTTTVNIVENDPSFFAGEVSLGGGVYYLQFVNGNYFGYFSYLTESQYIYHFDLGYEYVFDAADGQSGVYLYDFASSTFFYTSPNFPFPYLYDFTLNTVLYYYPDSSSVGRYTTNPRYFFDFATGQIITK